ncbi:MAG: hypothetical protein J7M34_03980, partial [Anaerolineae bacterium]|nr:hypothetical protein [Anaerolineae bacterium]
MSTYFSRQGWQPGPWAELDVSRTRAARYLRRIVDGAPGSWHVYLGRSFCGPSPIDALVPGLATECLILPDHVPVPPDRTGNVAYVLEPRLGSVADALQHYYPEARRKEERDITGRPLFVAVVIPARVVDRRGLRSAFWPGEFTAGTPVAEASVANPFSDSPAQSPIPAPYAHRLWGGLYLTETGAYRFRLGPSPGQLFLYLNDLLAVAALHGGASSVSPPIWLPQGVIPFRVEQVVPSGSGPALVYVEWMPPGAQRWEPIPPGRLLPVLPLNGIIAAYYRGDRLVGKPTRVVVAPLLLGDGMGRQDAYAVRWLCSLGVSEEGEYRFRLRSKDGARLYVDHRLVVDHWRLDDPSPQEGMISLKQGWVPVELRYFNSGG